ncbi:RagB/SusD domain protein [Bacteroides eggerthii]|uniref:RagB/SusD domain protein n=1 Tax=Bacteroides eggerthii TaxID=28111 RepID=A0A380ZM32_9BACE|nr:RagB/SusD domain protein [Bacteroides eggerthii]
MAFRGHAYSRAGVAPFTASTGYGVAKFDNTSLDLYNRNQIGTAYTDAPIYWLSIIYLNYAEAKAELGTLTQLDLNNTINKLQARAGLPDMTTTPADDPANNMGVSNLIWEIRRCRRCELMFDNWYRYWDLIRWHQLELLDSKKHPNVFWVPIWKMWPILKKL